MDYQTAVDYVQNAALFGSHKDGLVNIRELLRRLGDPQQRFVSIHVAGTNGKGSTCAFIESVLRSCGYRTALYTSPYLQDFTERMRINFQSVARDDFARIATLVRDRAEEMVAEGLHQPTFFELVTACAFVYFAEQDIDIAVIETGLGGRLDSTNVLTPLVCAITSIDYDHTAVLGSTLEEIAYEKAGIIKSGIPCVLSGSISRSIADYIANIAQERSAPAIMAFRQEIEVQRDDLQGQVLNISGDFPLNDLFIPLLGAHQRSNAQCALEVIHQLILLGWNLPEKGIRQGFASTVWPGRLELVHQDPIVLIEGAHNPQGMKALKNAIAHYLPGKPVCLLTGVLANKEYQEMADIMASFSTRILVTSPPSSRALPAERFLACFSDKGIPCHTYDDSKAALEEALSSGMAVVITGSLYLAGQIRSLLQVKYSF